MHCCQGLNRVAVVVVVVVDDDSRVPSVPRASDRLTFRYMLIISALNKMYSGSHSL